MKPVMGIDQYGKHYDIGYNPPRKYLLDYLGRKHCEKMYRDTVKGVAHVGYIISGLWITLYEIEEFRKY